ncbi:RNA-binding protein [Trypanosoma conorhini]|uniref:RNA-binding protein n=1 Tax=Trypanosoma conorhini TaxID=83891 RepID=A0A3R7PMC4_9TRYP|nr:RNA-binding protein [Trypanosoma conorhini]RNF27558.1 RNA-binding protein [Trypanosoma conorhini]
MDVLTRDLHHHHLARLLHLVPHLHAAFLENSFLLPLFFSCVSSAAKRHARLLLLCLQRRFGSLCPREVHLHVLSFLSFPEFAAAPPGPIRRQPSLHAGSRKRARAEMEGPVPPGHPKPTPTDAAVEREAEGVVAVDGEERTLKSSPQTETAEVEEEPSATEFLFHVRPPVEAAPASSAKTTTHLFVRMVSESVHNEETMNRFFGRYGQVSCTLLQQQEQPKQQQQQQHQGSVDVGHTEATVAVVQDFIVSVDSTDNALKAVRSAYYPELAFIAFHNPAFDAYTLADLDRVLHDVSVEIVGGPPPEAATEAEDEKDGANALPLHAFVPDVVVDGLPYWLTVDQLRVSFSEYGRVEDVRIAIDDRSGSFTGAALLRMSSVEEAIAASEGLNGAVLKDHSLVSGVLDDHLNIVSLRQGTIIRQADELLPADYDISENHRRWV